MDAPLGDDPPSDPAPAVVVAVACLGGHHFSKATRGSIALVEGLGVEGDGHSGRTIQHRSRVRRDPTQPNLRQVHLIQGELLDELAERGFLVAPAELGENITTRGIDLLGLPLGARLHIGGAVVEITGLRNPCSQIDTFRPGVLAVVVGRHDDGTVQRRAGVMGIVVEGGTVRPGDRIDTVLPTPPLLPLEPV